MRIADYNSIGLDRNVNVNVIVKWFCFLSQLTARLAPRLTFSSCILIESTGSMPIIACKFTLWITHVKNRNSSGEFSTSLTAVMDQLHHNSFNNFDAANNDKNFWVGDSGMTGTVAKPNHLMIIDFTHYLGAGQLTDTVASCEDLDLNVSIKLVFKTVKQNPFHIDQNIKNSSNFFLRT